MYALDMFSIAVCIMLCVSMLVCRCIELTCSIGELLGMYVGVHNRLYINKHLNNGYSYFQ